MQPLDQCFATFFNFGQLLLVSFVGPTMRYCSETTTIKLKKKKKMKYEK